MGSSHYPHSSLELLGLTDRLIIVRHQKSEFYMREKSIHEVCSAFNLPSGFWRLIASFYKTTDLQKA